MKRCAHCRRTYTDETLNFCLDDGKWLEEIPASEEPATAILTSESPTRVHSTEDAPSSSSTTAAENNAAILKVWTAGVLGVLLIASIGVGAYWFYGNRTSKQIDSIAVMPFVNDGQDPDLEYLSDGMTETLMNSLSQLPGLSVKARSSVFRYKGKATDAQTIGKELGVQAILNGRVVKRNDSITLFLELVDTNTGDRKWGGQYTEPVANLIALQNQIARDVSQKLSAKLSSDDQKKLGKNYTENAEAYQLYLKGRFAWNKRTDRDLQLAAEFFQQAIALDPDYALAYAGLADTYSVDAVAPSTTDPVVRRERLAKGREAALKALSIDNSLAEAHVALGTVLASYDYDFAGAEREYRRAIEINPDYADGRYWYAQLLSRLGRFDEASVEFKRALDLDPLNLTYQANYGGHLAWAGRHDEAIAYLRKTLELDENHGPTIGNLANAYELKGDNAKAVEMRARVRGLAGHGERAALDLAAFANGGWDGYLRYCTSESQSKGQFLYRLATCHLGLGEKDKAIAALNKAYEDREPALARLKVDRRFDPLRDDPRFHELLKKIGFPE
jgi:TolB-like protein/Flp pilus assembly protein TadD